MEKDWEMRIGNRMRGRRSESSEGRRHEEEAEGEASKARRVG